MLIIVTNIFVFFEHISVLKEKYSSTVGLEVYFCMDRGYIKSVQVAKDLYKRINKVCPRFVMINNEKAVKMSWDVAMCASYISDELNKTLRRLRCKKICYVEDGTYDYIGDDIIYTDLTVNNELWVFSPARAKNRECYKKVNRMQFSNETMHEMRMAFPEIEKLKRITDATTAIVFTSCIAEDYGYEEYREKAISVINKMYKGKTVIIKKHPRDTTNYISKEVNTIEVPRNIPGQLLNMEYKGSKMYMFPSTIAYTDSNLEKAVVVRFRDCKDTRYNMFYDKIGNTMGRVIVV